MADLRRNRDLHPVTDAVLRTDWQDIATRAAIALIVVVGFAGVALGCQAVRAHLTGA